MNSRVFTGNFKFSALIQKTLLTKDPYVQFESVCTNQKTVTICHVELIFINRECPFLAIEIYANRWFDWHQFNKMAVKIGLHPKIPCFDPQNMTVVFRQKRQTNNFGLIKNERGEQSKTKQQKNKKCMQEEAAFKN